MRRLGENTGVILSDPGVGHSFLGDSKTKDRTSQQNLNLLCLKGYHQEVKSNRFRKQTYGDQRRKVGRGGLGLRETQD